MRAFILSTAVVACALPLTVVAMADGNPGDEPPVIVEFDYMNPMDDYFVFNGWIEDEDPEGCTILFGDCLEGYYTSVDADGYFYLVVQLQPWQTGVGSAVAFDSDYDMSNEALTYVLF